MSVRPRVLVLRAPGTNCDEETAFAFERAGGLPTSLHVGKLLANPDLLSGFQVFCIPGGFTYGDDLSAGKIVANQLRIFLAETLSSFIERGGLVLGICNGFQTLVKAGILPGFSRPWRAEATLGPNGSGRFEARWVPLVCPPSVSVFTRGMRGLDLPVAHAEGKFVPASPEVLDRLRSSAQVAFRYGGPDYPANPNGSVDGIAGISDPTGRVLGLMPHPERCVALHHRPDWHALSGRSADEALSGGEGLQVFRNAVDTVG